MTTKQANTLNEEFRIEHDLLGVREVPAAVYWGVQTSRAIENFKISRRTIGDFPNLIKALAMVKKACALANHELGDLNTEKTRAIIQTCDELIAGKLSDQFPIDMIQGGAGTSTNMNANEVIANRALEIMGYKKGEYQYLHPNNDVNMAQSTNDVYPTASRLAMMFKHSELIKSSKYLKNAFLQKAEEFSSVIKMGRTQLQDAVPMSLGQEFNAFATSISDDIKRSEQIMSLLKSVNIGGTAIGTGITAKDKYSAAAIKHLSEITGFDLMLAEDLIEASTEVGDFVTVSSGLKRMAVRLSKISNDLRLLSSGPICGLNEINLPEMQPGSSIMPGKVNPVIPEAVNQVAFDIIGNDLTVTMAAEAGQLQLNVMEPIIVYKILSSIRDLANVMQLLSDKCITGITANESVCRDYLERGVGVVTALNPYIGYENSSRIAKQAIKTREKVVDIARREKLIDEETLEEVLKPKNMISPRKTVD